MLDAQRDSTPPKTIRLAEYQVPDFLIDTVDLLFELDEDHATVKSRLGMRRNPAADGSTRPLKLDGEALTLVSVALNGDVLGPNRYQVDGQSLTIPDLPREFVLDIETRIEPQNNTELSSAPSARPRASAASPISSTGPTCWPSTPCDRGRQGEAIRCCCPTATDRGRRSAGGRHFASGTTRSPSPAICSRWSPAIWSRSKRQLRHRAAARSTLRIYVERGDEDQARAYAMDALKRSMRWDEEAFGREYDLDVFMIVAVSRLQHGRDGEQGPQHLQHKYVLASPETATDTDYARIESVVAHEYFHNWTGNRITCRDWFQLSLKEGLTVFRDQEFSADMRSRGGQAHQRRARAARAAVPEDAGPLAHPVRPDSYIEIDNFYTADRLREGRRGHPHAEDAGGPAASASRHGPLFRAP
jgi:aminopeptidase N